MLNVYSRARWRNAAEPQLPRKGICLQRRHRPFVCGQRTGAGAAGIRDHFGAPVVITSGYRTAAHNRAVGGAVYSQHQYGRAADIRVSGVPVERLAAYAETLLPGTGGIGRYPAKGFVHVDVRKAKSRWVG